MAMIATNMLVQRIKWHQRRLEGFRDLRVGLLHMVVLGIRIIKMFAWEPAYKCKLTEKRDAELVHLSAKLKYGIAFKVLRYAGTFVGFVTFMVHTVIRHKTITVQEGFTALALFNTLRSGLMIWPQVINMSIQAHVGYGRLKRFLDAPEVPGKPSFISTLGPDEYSGCAPALSVQGGTFSHNEGMPARNTGAAFRWRGNSKNDHKTPPTLAAVRVEIPSNAITCVVGPCGSGKSSFLSALLGELQTDVDWPRDAPTNNTSAPDTNQLEEPSLAFITAADSARKASLALAPHESLAGPEKSVSAEKCDGGQLDENKGGVRGFAAVGLAESGSKELGYVPQKPWILNRSIRDNIILGSAFHWNRYWDVIDACCLRHDLDILPAGDMTEIGERGTNLSGGQQQRVSLARACYRHGVEVFLLDDVLSAVDAHVSEAIWNKCILGLLRKQRNATVILVTHQIDLCLRGVDRILLFGKEEGARRLNDKDEKSEKASLCALGDGVIGNDEIKSVSSTIRWQGTPADLSELSGRTEDRYGDIVDPGAQFALAQLGRHFLPNADEIGQSMAMTSSSSEAVAEGGITRNGDADDRKKGTGDEVTMTAGKGVKGGGGVNEEQAAVGQLVRPEKRNKGKISLRLYLNYMYSAGGLSFGVIWTSLGFGVQGMYFIQNLVFSDWVDQMSGEDGVDTAKENGAMLMYLYVTVGYLALILLRATISAFGSLRASRLQHQAMIARILHAPVSWYDATPIGRVINRFSSDLTSFDTEVMDELYSFVDAGAQVLAVVIVVLVIQPWTFVVMIPVVCLSLTYAHLYIQCARELKRLDSTTRSPIYGGFAEILAGLDSIRALDAQSFFFRAFSVHCDEHTKAELALWVSNRWLVMRLQSMTSLVVVAVAVFALYESDHLMAGLVLLYSVQYTNACRLFIKQHASVEMQMNYVERCDEYSRLPAQEGSWHSDPDLWKTLVKDPVTDTWPPKGHLRIRGLTVQYPSQTKPALTDLNLVIPPGTRVGVVGRTGAGKSTLASALFRLLEPVRGQMFLDGVDCAILGLHDVRQAFAIIPQDATLFEGTIRSNLDAFDDHSDEEIWASLKIAQLADKIGLLPGKLAAEVRAGGSNLSVGERQLLCMSRALLRGAKILIMDEATASVDPATDAIIQDTIRGIAQSVNKDATESRLKCSIICVAHRLETIIYYDKVLVLDEGKVAEYDSPAALLTPLETTEETTEPQQQGGDKHKAERLFLSLCSARGPDTLKRLRLAANVTSEEAERQSNERTDGFTTSG
uniref:Uncharacterized protein n=1 Tax=Octactis speculum TaxID=3111310 RepID=A0A7S2HWI2_9STRA